ncbi:MAG: abortive infection family protein [Phycisphaerales bacterium]|nr:abortive infection family protein [Phycisphaerales bacterium]
MRQLQPEKIPVPVIAVVADELANRYSHTKLDLLFHEHGAPGEPPPGNKIDKSSQWLRAINTRSNDPLAVLGALIQELMEVGPPTWSGDESDKFHAARIERIQKQLAKHGLRYVPGGRILGATAAPQAKTLTDLIDARDLAGVKVELERAYSYVQSDPAGAATAACALLESVFVHVLELAVVPLPADKSVIPLWKSVRDLLDLVPDKIEDDDLKKVLGGLASIVHGVGELRTHAGSAHGRGSLRYKVLPRHARLVVASAVTIGLFVLETWFERRAS